MPDLLVSIPSRDRPDELLRTLQMLESTYKKKSNFDIQCIIDSDQVELYRTVQEKYSMNIWSIIEHSHNDWLNIYDAQHNLFLNGNYYFFWNFPDDVYGLWPRWDKAILERRNFFLDGLFVLYTQSVCFSRTPEAHKRCYVNDLDAHECNPIWTRKWGEFIIPLFQRPTKYITFREIIIAALIRILFVEYGLNRNVECNVDYKNATNQLNSARMAQSMFAPTEMIDNVPIAQRKKWDELKPIAWQMKDYIDGFERTKKYS